MATDKVIINTGTLNDIANALRTATGNVGGSWKPSEMAAEIERLSPDEPSEDWKRPAGWPNLDLLPFSENTAYFTADCREAKAGAFNFFALQIQCTGTCTVERGSIVNGAFVADATLDTFTNTSKTVREEIPSNGDDYVVYRVSVTGGELTKANFVGWSGFNGGNQTLTKDNQPIVEAYVNMPSEGNVITTSMFESLRMLEHVKINIKPKGLANTMFSKCHQLCKLEGNIDTSGITSMYNMFYQCSSLRSLDVSGWDTSGVTFMQSMFYQCSSLRSLDVSGWDTSSVTNMQYMFYQCSSLRSLDVSGWDTSSVTNMQYMFYQCSSLRSLDVSGWDTSSVTNMQYMFSQCTSLRSLDVSGWDTSGVTFMQSMFYQCSSLQTPVVFNSPSAVIQNMTFRYCSVLPELVIGERTDSPTSIVALDGENAFNETNSYFKIYVPDALVNDYKTATYWSQYADRIYGVSDRPS